jgi:hypothetical protein
MALNVGDEEMYTSTRGFDIVTKTRTQLCARSDRSGVSGSISQSKLI